MDFLLNLYYILWIVWKIKKKFPFLYVTLRIIRVKRQIYTHEILLLLRLLAHILSF